MPALILYLLKANIALVLFYLAYHLVLRKLTFYHLNRLFLVFGIAFSTLYPFIDVAEMFSQHQELAVINTYVVAIPAWAATTAIPEQAPAFDYWQILVLLIWLGTAVMVFRLLLQFTSLYKIHAGSVPASYKGIGFRQVSSISQAFSFWKSIYLNPEQHKQEELQSILQHEQVHVKGWHTLDVLLAELCTVFYWFNPGMWLMKKAIKENLEFIADQHVVDAGVDRKEYQYLLLKVIGTPEPQIANQFNFPSLKRRIAMMNKMPSTKAHLLKFLTVIPVAAILLLIFGNVAQLQAETIDVTGYTKLGPDIYIKQGPTFQSACWTAPNTLTITPVNGGAAENYQLDNEQDIATAISKYGLYLPNNELYEKLSASTSEVTKQNNADTNNPQGATLPKELVEHLKKNPAVKSVRGKVIDNRIAIVISLKGGGTEVYYLDDAKSIDNLERKYKLPELPPPPPPTPAKEELPPPPPPVQANDSKAYIFSIEDEPYYKNNLPADYKAFLDRNPSIRKIGWKFEDRINFNLESVVILLKNGKVETYDFNQNQRIPALEAKYGQLPNLPAPPPPVPAKEQLPPPPVVDHSRSLNKAFYERNPNVINMVWLSTGEMGIKQKITGFVLKLKNGEMERYDYSDRESINTYKKKYGDLPVVPESYELPAPPPPAPAKKNE